MVQEFHVLRCFSCQTFQVQQVKKSKKWSCKVCGEKQSLLKEYGRGTGVDCRRHVQKLNLLRGELLEVENEKARIQWEKEKECEVKEDFGDEAQSCEEQGVSRWSKYLDRMDSRPGGDEDNEVDENVYTDRERLRSRDNKRNRKKCFTSRGADGHDRVCEEDVTSTWGIAAHRRGKELLFEPQQDGYALGGHSSAANEPPSFTKLATKHPTVHATSHFATTYSFPSLSETNMEARGSKWTRFLTTVTAEEDESEEDNADQMSAKTTDGEPPQPPSSPVKPTSQVANGNAGHLGSGDVCGRVLLGDKLDLCSTAVSTFEKLSQCLGQTSNQSSPTFKSVLLGSKKPVCLQPPPFKRPCPTLSSRTFFYTDEDFDDTF